MPIRYHAIEEALPDVEAYFRHNVKHCDRIVAQHRPFFESLSQVRRITLLGHSLGEVDMPYFREILRHIERPAEVEWRITTHTPQDVERREKFYRRMHITSEQHARSDLAISDFR